MASQQAHPTTIAQPTIGTDPLETIRRLIARGEVARGMCRLFTTLDAARERSTPAGWQQFCARVQAHPLRALIHQDPMSKRSFDKPRGYAGDAELLDYIYGLKTLDGVSDIGRAVHDYCLGRASICAVRHRRDLLAHRIDQAADGAGGAGRVLSVACGHLREADHSAAVRAGWVRDIAGLDADRESLAVAAAAHPGLITPWHLSIRRLLGREAPLGKFHLTYSAGLYDYLEDAVAVRLTRRMFDTLHRGGRLLVCNFLTSVPDVGYMESLMGWKLILRKLEELPRLLAEIPAAQIGEVRTYSDPFAAVGYLEVRKAR